MELKWLEDFLSLAHRRSFSRSATERNVTQPAFSRRIKALENWICAPLIDRSTFPTTLTPEGRAFRETAEEVVRLVHRERDEFLKQRRTTQASLSFAALHTLSLTLYPRWILHIERHLGPLNTRLMSENLHDCMQALSEGDCDFLLCYAHDEVPVLLDPLRFPSVTIATDLLLPVSIPDDRNEPKFLLPGSLEAPLPYLSYTSEHFLGKIEELILERSEVPLHLVRKYENPMAEALKAMALQGHGVAWLPESSVQLELEQGRLVRAGRADLEISMEVLFYRSMDKARPLVEKLWNFVSAQPDFD